MWVGKCMHVCVFVCVELPTVDDGVFFGYSGKPVQDEEDSLQTGGEVKDETDTGADAASTASVNKTQPVSTSHSLSNHIIKVTITAN